VAPGRGRISINFRTIWSQPVTTAATTLPATSDLREWARRFPAKPAIIMGSGAMLTYADLDRRSDALAQRLYDFGLRFGDHVAG